MLKINQTQHPNETPKNQKEKVMKRPTRKGHASSICVTPNIAKIVYSPKMDANNFLDKEENNKNFNKNTTSYSDLNSIPLRCFICGSLFLLPDFETHYFPCKSLYNQKNSVSNKKVNEPKDFGDFFNKIVVEALTKDDIDHYNIFAEKHYFEQMCKACSNCHDKVNVEIYDKHLRSCLSKISCGSLNNQNYITVNRLKDTSCSVNICEDFSNVNIESNSKQNNSNTTITTGSNNIKISSFNTGESLMTGPGRDNCNIGNSSTHGVKRNMRKKSMDDIRNLGNLDIKEIRNNMKHYFI